MNDSVTERVLLASRSAPQLGTVKARLSDNWDAAVTYYRLDGRRISGTVTIAAVLEPRADEPLKLDHCRIAMVVGRGDPHHWWRDDLDDPLTINTVLIRRGYKVISGDEADFRTGQWDPYVGDRLPYTTGKTANTVLRMVAAHWVSRPEHERHRVGGFKLAYPKWKRERREELHAIESQINARRAQQHLIWTNLAKTARLDEATSLAEPPRTTR